MGAGYTRLSGHSLENGCGRGGLANPLARCQTERHDGRTFVLYAEDRPTMKTIAIVGADNTIRAILEARSDAEVAAAAEASAEALRATLQAEIDRLKSELSDAVATHEAAEIERMTLKAPEGTIIIDVPEGEGWEIGGSVVGGDYHAVPPPPLEARKQEAIDATVARGRALRAKLLRGYEDYEIDSFFDREREARAISAGELPASEASFLMGLFGSQQAVTAAVPKIIAKADSYKAALAALGRLANSARVAIAAATTHAELDAAIVDLMAQADAADADILKRTSG